MAHAVRDSGTPGDSSVSHLQDLHVKEFRSWWCPLRSFVLLCSPRTFRSDFPNLIISTYFSLALRDTIAILPQRVPSFLLRCYCRL
jgi:hypothetical protein